jgi:hypothetical protein
MKEFFQKNITAVIVVVLVLGALLAYLKYFRSGATSSTDDKSSAGSSEVAAPSVSSSGLMNDLGVDLPAELQKLQELDLINGNSIFSRADFKSLSDTQLEIIKREKGRSNPFANI